MKSLSWLLCLSFAAILLIAFTSANPLDADTSAPALAVRDPDMVACPPADAISDECLVLVTFENVGVGGDRSERLVAVGDLMRGDYRPSGRGCRGHAPMRGASGRSILSTLIFR